MSGCRPLNAGVSRVNRVTRILVAAVLISVVAAGGFLAYRGNYGQPRADPSSSTGFYIPRDLDDALIETDRILGRRGRNEVVGTKTESEMAMLHFGVGLWMRNNWGLWSDSRLAAYFKGIGVNHPDDMSGIILKSYWRQEHHLPINLEQQVRYYKDFWESARSDSATTQDEPRG